jgi:hypothetical protein
MNSHPPVASVTCLMVTLTIPPSNFFPASHSELRDAVQCQHSCTIPTYEKAAISDLRLPLSMGHLKIAFGLGPVR